MYISSFTHKKKNFFAVNLNQKKIILTKDTMHCADSSFLLKLYFLLISGKAPLTPNKDQ